MKAILVSIIFFVSLTTTAYSDFLIGIGYGIIKLPSNDADFALIGPDGESTGDIMLYAENSAKEEFGFGVSFSGYTFTKTISDWSGSIGTKWEVYHINPYLSYRAPLGDSKKSPTLGLRLGVSIVPVKFSADVDVFSYDLSDSESQTEYGPYVGIDLLVPISGSSTFIFLSGGKTFATFKDDVNVGSMVFGAGIAFKLNHGVKSRKKQGSKL